MPEGTAATTDIIRRTSSTGGRIEADGLVVSGNNASPHRPTSGRTATIDGGRPPNLNKILLAAALGVDNLDDPECDPSSAWSKTPRAAGAPTPPPAVVAASNTAPLPVPFASLPPPSSGAGNVATRSTAGSPMSPPSTPKGLPPPPLAALPPLSAPISVLPPPVPVQRPVVPALLPTRDTSCEDSDLYCEDTFEDSSTGTFTSDNDNTNTEYDTDMLELEEQQHQHQTHHHHLSSGSRSGIRLRNLTTRELARNLTLLDQRQFLAIQPVEFWHVVRHAKEKQTLAPRVLANISWFNQVRCCLESICDLLALALYSS